jgi:hypothetical protein
VERYKSPEDTVLAVSALLNGKIPSKSTYLSNEFSAAFDEKWSSTLHGIKKGVHFLEDEKILDARRLPSEVVVYVICALWANVSEGGDKEGESRFLIRRFMWRAFFTERYDRNTNRRAYLDYQEVLKLLNGEAGEPEIFNDDFYPVPTEEELMTASWPKRKDRLGRAILAVSLKYGGFDFADGAPAKYENIQSREYHHIFPESWLRDKQYKPYEIYRALNCALISWRTNRTLSNNAPSSYVAERMEQASLGEPEVVRRLESHLIPRDEISQDDYQAFLQRRADKIKGVADKLCNGEIVEGIS